jgi:hypothetical protein
MPGRTSRLKPYTKRNAVGVGIAVRKNGMDGRGRNRYRKSWLLKNVIFTLATESPSHAPPRLFWVVFSRPFCMFSPR